MDLYAKLLQEAKLDPEGYGAAVDYAARKATGEWVRLAVAPLSSSGRKRP